nr:PREDICTED: zinc finger protein 800 [Linepithema humile]XP_012231930.1 PREDICTED: zinc finger protein 800 [Linepithema humile]XP_012231931.1 PREDICTED: zinc finger protein 800 [Linepithema humile]
MKSVMIKDKTKKKSETLKKIKVSSRNMNNSPDLSILRKPIDTSASDLYQVSQLLKSGTDEVKSILSYECNIIYECRTCRSLFRSIINLISHKREYCKEKFDVAFGKDIWNNSHKESIIHLYKTEQTINKDDTSVKNDRILRSQSKEATKKDLSTIVDMLSKKRKEENGESHFSSEVDVDNAISSTPTNPHIYLEPISTNCSAMYQTVKSSNTADNVDLMKVQVAELQNIANQKITLDGQVLEKQAERSNSPVQTNMSDEKNESLAHKLPLNNLSCTLCKAKFATKKTLHVHMKVLHTPHRKCYLCPCCTSTFANTWSVHRHLYRVHRKTNEQVRKLRLQIQQKVLDREITSGGLRNTRTTKASVCKKATTKDCDISQGSVDHVESNVQLRIGSKRRKKVNKKKALSADYETSIAEHDDITINSSPSSEISFCSTSSNILSKTEDTNAIIDTIIESPNKTDILDAKSDKYTSDKCTSSSSENDEETSICVQDSCNREDWDTLEDNCSFECNSMHNNNDPSTIKSSMKQDINNKESLLFGKDEDHLVSDKDLQLSFTEDIKEGENRKLSSQHDEKQLTDAKERNVKSPALLIEKKIAKIVNFEKVRCLLCKRKFTSVPNLRRHVAMHIGWNRYRCKLCEYKCFTKCDCVLHCNKAHNAQNNRKMLAEMIIEIPPNEYTYDEDMIDEPNTGDKVDGSDVDVIKSTDQSEIHADLDNLDDSNTSVLQSKTANEQVVESQETTEHQNVDVRDHETTVTEDWIHDTEYTMNDQSEKLNPDLKRMIMEVIFGSTDTSTTKQTDADKPVVESSTDAREHVNANDNENSSASTDNSKEASCAILDTSKHQRPMRNRIRPLNNDFIYDLEEIASRKESALSHDYAPLRKKAKLSK